MKKAILLLVTVCLIILFNSCQQNQTNSIMSFNIRYDNPNDGKNNWSNRKIEVAQLIEAYHPDLLGIQEGLLHQINFIKNNTSNYEFIGVGREDGKTKGEFAPIFYDNTKFINLKHNTFWLSETPDTISRGWDAALERICTYGEFQHISTGNKIHVFNAHFDHMGEEAREMSAILILRKINEYKLKNSIVVVMGDFNAEPNSKPILTFNAGLNDGMSITEERFTGENGTFNGFDTIQQVDKRIDYIFTNTSSVKSYTHISKSRKNRLRISDHFPVMVSFTIK